MDWVDPLRGYAYDSINRDASLRLRGRRLATVRDGRIELPAGASYAVLVLPAVRPLSPEGDRMTPEVAARLRELVSATPETRPGKSVAYRPTRRELRTKDIFARERARMPIAAWAAWTGPTGRVQ